jgi:hypothetical protein
MINKKTFKTSFNRILEESVDGLTNEQKIKYMKKWIRDYENMDENTTVNSISPLDSIQLDTSEKVGELVSSTLDKIIRKQLLSPEKVRVLQDERHSKNLFDINYPMLKKVTNGSSLLEQRMVNGYSRYWAKPVKIHNEKYLVCNDWYERNKTKFIIWAKSLL